MWFDIAVFLFTDLASVATMYTLCAGLAALAWWQGEWEAAMAILVVSVACGLSVVGLKEWFAVARPDNPLIVVDTYAFPSGHATGAMFCGVLLWVYTKYVFERPLHLGLVSVAGALVIAIGSSRTLFQVHTVEQVLVGYALGAAWGILLWWWMKRRQSNSKENAPLDS